MTELDLLELFNKSVDFERRFHVRDGPDLPNLRALLAFLPEMTDAQFQHHVHPGKNDFAQWIEDIHGAGSVTRLMRGARTKDELKSVLEGKLAEYHAEKEALRKQQSASEQPVPLPKEQGPDASGRIMDDGSFVKLRDEYGKRNEGLQEKYDDIARRMKEALEDPFPEALIKVEEEIRARYEELRARTSELRKQGRDTFIATLILRQFPSKLGLAHATRVRDDYEQARIVLQQAQFELDQVARAELSSVKEDVLRRAGQGIING